MLLLTIKNKLYKWCCALALLVQAAVVDSANIGTEPIVNLSITDGLASETVNRVISDHSGQVWIATTNGVNLYNGKSLVAFRLSDASHRMVVVKDLCETSDKSIYAATEFGLYRLEYGKHDFEKVLPEVAQPSCLLSVGDTLYIGGLQGIQIYDGQTLKTVQVGASPNGIDLSAYVKTLTTNKFSILIAKVTDEAKSSQFFTKEAAAMNWNASINDGAAVSEEDVRPQLTVAYKSVATAVIGTIASEQNYAEGIYSLSGQRLSQPVKGLNIINGKKVLVK